MKQSHISRNCAKVFFAFATVGVAGACADSVAAPTKEVAFKAPPAFDITVGVRVFRVGPEGVYQRLGAHTLVIPQNAVCDPLLSSYGTGEWDKPCTPLTRSIYVTATMMEDNAGNPYVDFQPALRFVPTKTVNLFLYGTNDNPAISLNIDYCNNLGFCVDESKTDLSLVTRRISGTSIAMRRIKHFSGYLISLGEPCSGWVQAADDGTQYCNDGRGFGLRSGYMVASGLGSTTPDDDQDDTANPPPVRKRPEQ